MTVDQLIQSLGYEGSPHFLRRGDPAFETEPSFGHVFRRSGDRDDISKRWRLAGVYGLRDQHAEASRFVPIVYVCEADDSVAAQQLHRLVWNQDTVPYVVSLEPKGVRVYSGFQFNPQGENDAQRGVLAALTDFERIDTIIRLFSAGAIDSGAIWKQERLQVDTTRRVYHRLLDDLNKLDRWLRITGKLSRDVSHALIGKYVYLRYLRDRGILSDERLTGLWGIAEGDVFSRSATKVALGRLMTELEEWLNGSIFPLRLHGPGAPSSEQIRRVAGTFAGDDPDGQLGLNFQHYDFSYIPIETLSLIYEQFLHAEDEDKKAKPGKSRGREAGAYYTPLPLVNFTLATLEQHRPLQAGMRIIDPACGSGVFLVQAYRRLVETTFPAQPGSPRPKPGDLRRLLQDSIYGIDIDPDACQVTQLSLVLTLLDYVDPPDLTGRQSGFKLPSLIGENILNTDFFIAENNLEEITRKHGFDWVVGNPPWKQLKSANISEVDQAAWGWMQTHAKTAPVGMYQLAQAFAWRAPQCLAVDGECALLVPAMGLFEEPSKAFRKAFFSAFDVHTVANFSNLAEVLFDGRARVPCAALFYRACTDDVMFGQERYVTTYSPIVVNQEATRPQATGERRKLWNLVINGSEIRILDQRDVAGGSGLPWKLAMWGTPWDERLVNRMEKKWDSLEILAENNMVLITEGPQLSETDENTKSDKPTYEHIPTLTCLQTLDVKKMGRLREVFSFPAEALSKNTKAWLRLRGGKEGLRICVAPQIHVSAARNYAIFSDEPVIVSPRQIGIVSPSKDSIFLKALSLYLSSDFAFYHQFLRSTQFGVQRGLATLEALRQLPIPLAELSRAELQVWADLHAELVKLPPRGLNEVSVDESQPDLFANAADNSSATANRTVLLRRLNELTADALGLDDRERALVHDLVRVRLALNDGKRGDEAMRPPTSEELARYAQRLKQELDDFIADSDNHRHRVTVVHETDSAMIEVDLIANASSAKVPRVLSANSRVATKLCNVRSGLEVEYAQWVYFERNLRVYRGTKTYLFKPLQRFQWTESAAMMDASDLIAETLAGTA